MTTPIDPGDTAALAKIAYDHLLHHGNVPFEQRISGSVEKYRKIADAVARAVCPIGFSVVADDDLREAIKIIAWYCNGIHDAVDAGEDAGWMEAHHIENGVLPRLRALIGDEG